MRTLLALLLISVAACSRAPAERPRAVQKPAAPQVATMLELRSGDGRVYVLKSPDQLGIESTTCFLHVSASGTGAIACAPPRFELTESSPAP